MPAYPEGILTLMVIGAGAIAAFGFIAFATYAAFFQKH